MLKHYLTVAYRALWREKGHTLINIFGLSLGIVCCILIALFVKNEWTYDTFHAKADRTYRLWSRENWGENQIFFSTVTPFPAGPALKETFPEVESQVRLSFFGSQAKSGERAFNEAIACAGQQFFDLFDFPVVSGTTKGALNDIQTLVISQKAAVKYFGKSDPVNQVISLQIGERFEDFTVKAVVENMPTNSSIQFDLMVSELNYTRLYNPRQLTAWFNVNPETYILLREGVDPRKLEAKFPDLLRTAIGEDDYKNSHYEAGLQPLKSIHLDTSFPVGISPVGNPTYVYVLAAIALLILVIACINFVTLSVGRSIRRAREVGVRKVVGAARSQLINQFIGEAVLVTLISLIIGLVVSRLALPAFNNLAGKNLRFDFNLFTVGLTVSLLVIIGLLAGSYPALVLSAFRPMVIFKGVSSSGRSQLLRKVLVGVQLTLSIFLIASTLIMRNQLQFLQNKDLGFNKEQLAVIPMNVKRTGRMADRVHAGFEKAEQFKTEISRIPGVISASGSSHDFGTGAWMNIGFTDDNGVYRTFSLNIVDDDYAATLKLTALQGRTFSDSIQSDRRRAVVINESLAKAWGLGDAIGKRLPGKAFPDHEIIGVVKDFNFASLYTPVGPLVLVMDPVIILPGSENMNVDASPIPKLFVRLSPGTIAETMESIHAAWDRVNAGEDFAFSFTDESLNRQYASDQHLGKIVSVAALLAILIGSLGLYGLASLAMQNRTKEIGIRKVLGATQESLLVLLSKEYIALILICLVISIPMTLFAMEKWLTIFQYRVAIGWLSFVLAGSISVFVTLLAIGHQTLKAAATQPAETLKYE